MRRFWLSVRTKLLVLILGVVLPVLVLVVVLTISRFHSQGLEMAREVGKSRVAIQVQLATQCLNSSLSMVRTLANVVNGASPLELPERRAVLDSAIYWHQTQYTGATSILYLLNRELLDSGAHGEIARQYYRNAEGFVVYVDDAEVDGLRQQNDYENYRSMTGVAIIGPYINPRVGVYVLNICTPIRDDRQQTIGLLGVEIPISHYEHLLDFSHQEEGCNQLLVGANGRIIASFNPEFLSENMTEIPLGIPELEQEFALMLRGESLFLPYRDLFTEEARFLYSAPVFMEHSGRPVSLLYSMPQSLIMHELDRSVFLGYLLLVLALGVVSTIIFWYVSRVTRRVRAVQRSLRAIAAGRIDSEIMMRIDSRDELGDISSSANELLSSLAQKVAFAQAIGRGRMDMTLSDREDDMLAHSLVQMRESLVEADRRERDQRVAEKELSWATEGMALFSEVLRRDVLDLETFAFHAISHLVRYTQAVVGALYIREVDDQGRECYGLASAFAYDVRKFIQTRIYPSEGLVGRCAAEGTRIYFTDVPEDYVKIASGLGFDKPDSLLLVPAIMSGQVEAVIELARFGGFKEYVMDFVGEAAESLAATLVTLRNNLQNQRLVEESRAQSEEMRQQERQMRRSLEEQEELRAREERQRARLESLENAVRGAYLVAEFNLEGGLEYANGEFLSVHRMTLSEALGRRHASLIEISSEQIRAYEQFWEDLRAGKTKRHVRTRIELMGRRYTFDETYSPLCDEMGAVHRILMLGVDITEFDGGQGPVGFHLESTPEA